MNTLAKLKTAKCQVFFLAKLASIGQLGLIRDPLIKLKKKKKKNKSESGLNDHKGPENVRHAIVMFYCHHRVLQCNTSYSDDK